jgi:hypothetical protein
VKAAARKPPTSRTIWQGIGLVVLVVFVGVGALWSGSWSGILEHLDFSKPPTRQAQGEILGTMPKPTQPLMAEPLLKAVGPNPAGLQKMVVRRIPTLVPGARMPHPSWGPCTKCHLIQGGAPPGSQPATPVAKVWEQVSAFHKVGPPILPNSARPHPPSGRCIKCHDILVYVQK